MSTADAAPAFVVEIYEARDGWRWRVKAQNHRIVAESGEAYTRKRACIAAYERVMVEAPLTVERDDP